MQKILILLPVTIFLSSCIFGASINHTINSANLQTAAPTPIVNLKPLRESSHIIGQTINYGTNQIGTTDNVENGDVASFPAHKNNYLVKFTNYNTYFIYNKRINTNYYGILKLDTSFLNNKPYFGSAIGIGYNQNTESDILFNFDVLVGVQDISVKINRTISLDCSDSFLFEFATCDEETTHEVFEEEVFVRTTSIGATVLLNRKLSPFFNLRLNGMSLPENDGLHQQNLNVLLGLNFNYHKNFNTYVLYSFSKTSIKSSDNILRPQTIFTPGWTHILMASAGLVFTF